ncbi:MAG: hypothetical protein ACNA7J_14310 [Wenzhouxiangella sp.]
MYLPPPIDRTPRMPCPACGQLTPKKDAECVHCGRVIPDAYRQEQRRLGAKRRQRARAAAMVLVPLGLVLLTLIFHRAGF